MFKDILFFTKIQAGLIEKPRTDKRKSMWRENMQQEQTNNNKTKWVRVGILLLAAVIMLMLTDPSIAGNLPFTIPGTVLSLVSIINFSYIGFMLTTLLPDYYMDDEYEDVDKSQHGQVKIARAIHTFGFCLIYATMVFVFIN